MRNTLKHILQFAGFKKEYYCVHSFRTGRAMDLLKYGVLVETIKKLGRWKSNAVFTYLS